MEKKYLEAIQGAVRHARDIISVFSSEDYPNTLAEDDDIGKLFYDLNRMCITLSKKIDGLEVAECPTTDITPASNSASAPEN